MNKPIRSSARGIIYKVYRRCLAEQEARTILSDLDNVYQRTAEMTGKSISTVRRVVREGDQNGGVFSTPGKNKTGRPKKEIDNFDICAIRQKVQLFYSVRKQVPTLRNLLPVLRDDLNFTGSREYLRKLLIALGFKYKKCQSERTVLMERSNIAAKRRVYLKTIIENRNLPEELRKDIIYLDESYVHQSYKLKKCWQSLDVSGVKQNVSKGKRYIIIHAGSEKGFISNALLIFSGTNKNSDYYSEMNKNNFTKWVKEKLIPNLPPASIIVMDNAPYHSAILNKAPTSTSKVAEIKEWLKLNDIPFEDSLIKPQLLTLVKRFKSEPIYEIDELLGAYEHSVVRLPPYHCDLNPIELIWGIAKHKIAAHNVDNIDIKEAAERAFEEISVEDWRKSCQHVIKIEKDYYERELTLYEEMDKIIVNVQDDTSSSSESDDLDDFGDNSVQEIDDYYTEIEYLEESCLD